MLSEDVFGRELQEHAVDELIFIGHEVALLGKTVALLAAEQDTAGRHQDEAIQRHGVSVMNVSEPLDRMERIAAGNVVTSSSVRPADTDDGMSGNISVDADSTDDTGYMVDPDRSGERDLSLISHLPADCCCDEQRHEQRYNFLFHAFYEVYNRLLDVYRICVTPKRAMREAAWQPRPPKRTNEPRRKRTREYPALS